MTLCYISSWIMAFLFIQNNRVFKVGDWRKIGRPFMTTVSIQAPWLCKMELFAKVKGGGGSGSFTTCPFLFLKVLIWISSKYILTQRNLESNVECIWPCAKSQATLSMFRWRSKASREYELGQRLTWAPSPLLYLGNREAKHFSWKVCEKEIIFNI